MRSQGLGFIVLAGLLACGGTVASSTGDAGDAAAALDGSPPTEAGGTCVSPGGYHGCGGPNGCNWDDTTCGGCLPETTGHAGAFSVCEADLARTGVLVACQEGCSDGDICVELDVSPTYSCEPFEVGALFDQNGASDRLLYADWSKWTSDPLPVPTACPSVSGFSICGGACPPCGTGRTCTGRSPLHSSSICIPDPNSYCSKDGKHKCATGQSCFVWTVQAAEQPLADSAGYCMATAECQAAAAGVPGGGQCIL